MSIDDVTRTVIGCSFKVHNALGQGFLEACYENALRIELEKLGIRVLQQEPLDVWYEDHIVGTYRVDLWIPNQLIVEVKSVQNLTKDQEVKLVHYLAATRTDDGLLINFGRSVEVRRKYRLYTPQPLTSTRALMTQE